MITKLFDPIYFENSSATAWLEIFTQTIDDPHSLPRLLASHGYDADTLMTLAQKSLVPGEAYGRKILFQNETIEVMLANWSYQAEASPHNHGASKGLIWFAQGNFSEQHYEFSNRSLNKTSSIFYKENQVVRVDQNDIHSCRPETTGLSLHLYSPPIHKMKVWDQAGRRTLTVADHCGAWVPQNADLILQETPW